MAVIDDGCGEGFFPVEFEIGEGLVAQLVEG
jgi:hypothetical protein